MGSRSSQPPPAPGTPPTHVSTDDARRVRKHAREGRRLTQELEDDAAVLAARKAVTDAERAHHERIKEWERRGRKLNVDLQDKYDMLDGDEIDPHTRLILRRGVQGAAPAPSESDVEDELPPARHDPAADQAERQASRAALAAALHNGADGSKTTDSDTGSTAAGKTAG